MIVNQDIRGIQAWATTSNIKPSNKNPRGNMLTPLNKIKEMKITPFKGLSTNMAGRDLRGYAVVKNFSVTQRKNDIMSTRMINPTSNIELYPQPKKYKFKSSLNIKPSELDMVSKLKNDNAKLLVLQILKSRSIGIEHLRGNPGQRVRLLKAYNDLCAKYELEYTNNRPGSQVILIELENQFKREVQSIYGIPYDDLNKPADTREELEEILRAIQDTADQLNNIFAAPIDVNVVAGAIAGAMGPAGPPGGPLDGKHDTPEETDDMADIDKKIKDLIDDYTVSINKYMIDIPLFDPDETFKNIIQAIDLQNRNVKNLRELRTLMLGIPTLAVKTKYYNKLLETYQHMKEYYEPEGVDSDDEDVVYEEDILAGLDDNGSDDGGLDKKEEGKYERDEKMRDKLEEVLDKLNLYSLNKKVATVTGVIRRLAVDMKTKHFKPPARIQTLKGIEEYVTNDWDKLIELEQCLDMLIIDDEREQDKRHERESKDVKEETTHRSQGKLINGIVYVECYDCKKDIKWNTYEQHIKTADHRENEKITDFIWNGLLGPRVADRPPGPPPGYDRDMGIDALSPVGDKGDDIIGDLEMKIQREAEKLQVKVGGSENKVIQLLKGKIPKMPDDINNLEDFYLWTDELTIKVLTGVLKNISELNADNLPNNTKQETKTRSAEEIGDDGKIRVTCYICDKKMLVTSYDKHLTSVTHKTNSAKKQITGNGRKKIKSTRGKRKTIRGKGLSVAELRARLKLIMN
jgi:hypothetical protein